MSTSGGNAGYISVQTTDTRFVTWGVYMYDSAADEGPWSVDVFVGKRLVDHKEQGYPPHGRVNPKDSKPGQIFHLDATHVDQSGKSYSSVPNACVIP